MKKTLLTLLLALLIMPAVGISLVSCSEDAASESVLPQISRKEARAELKKRGIKKKQYDDALFTAACDGDAELVQLLIIAGADVNKRHILGNKHNSISRTPLTMVISLGNLDSGPKYRVVKTLLAAPDINLNVTIDTPNGPISMLEFAERQDMTEIAERLRAAGAK